MKTIKISLQSYMMNKLLSRYDNESEIDLFIDVVAKYKVSQDKRFIIHVVNNFLYKAKSREITKIYELKNIEIEEYIKAIVELAKIKMNVCFIGLGGINFNLIEFISQLYDKFTEDGIIKDKIFNAMYIYDNDNISWTDILRLPIQEYKAYTKKVNYAKNYKHICENLILKDKYFDEEEIINLSNKYNNDILFIGAFDMNTRRLFAKYNDKKVLYIGYLNEKLYLFNNFEKIEESIIGNETYGIINIYHFVTKIAAYLPDIADNMIKAYNNEKIDKIF